MSCPHQWRTSAYEGYARCAHCNTLYNLDPAPFSVYEADYWTAKQGHSTLDEQVYNVESHRESGKTKNEFILDLLPPFSHSLLEIGCAPGSTLKAIWKNQRAAKLTGIEVDPANEYGIRKIADCPLVLGFGFFPEIGKKLTDGGYDCILACDVFEHSDKPDEFLSECNRLLIDGGTLVLMLPLALEDGLLESESARHPEHIYLHTKSHMRRLLHEHGFNDVDFSQWCPIHDCIRAVKL